MPEEIRPAGAVGENELLKKLSVFEEIRDLFRGEGDEFDEKDFEELLQKDPELPPFPLIIFLLAVFKDALDGVFTFFVVTSILSTIFGLIFLLIIRAWMFGKMGFGRKAILKFIFETRWFLAVIEMIPFLAAVPGNTIFVLFAHYRETKAVRLFFLAAEKLRSAGLK